MLKQECEIWPPGRGIIDAMLKISSPDHDRYTLFHQLQVNSLRIQYCDKLMGVDSVL